jgi:uncharacterized membrane protein
MNNMSYQDPNQPQYPNSGQYGGGYNPNNPNPQPTDPYSGQQYNQGGYQSGANYQQQSGPNYQQPYGQPGAQGGYQQNPYGGQQSNLGPSSMNIDPNVAAGLSYITWIAGLIFFLGEKQNRFVRFNAMQCLILEGGLTILGIVIQIIAIASSSLALVFGCLLDLVGLAAFVLIIIAMVNAFQGKYFKIPVIGDYAERYANQGTTNTTY